ncbi:hypothetical protein LEP1GSC074_1307 [Leptospira noguchii str. Hook]|nr:hypothetical protein LEP1GSC074_1307 [Leptospira noguchii str. Hook]
MSLLFAPILLRRTHVILEHVQKLQRNLPNRSLKNFNKVK